MIESSNIPEAFSEHAKSIMTLRSGKVIKHTSKINETDPKPLTEAKSPKNKEDLKIENKQTAPESSYLPKAPFLDALKAPIPADKKGGKLDEMLELFKQVQINLPLLDAIKQVPAYAKFLKDLCIQNVNLDHKFQRKYASLNRLVLSSSMPLLQSLRTQEPPSFPVL